MTLVMLVPLLMHCKSSSKLSKAEPGDSTILVDDDITTIDSLSAGSMDDMLKVSNSIRQDLEAYFSNFASLDLQDEEKRQLYLDKSLEHFDSPNTPVLIIVSQVNGAPVYDKPITIEKYFDYLKHTRQNPHTIHNFHLNDDGKINQLELILK